MYRFLSIPPNWAFKLVVWQITIPLLLMLYDLNV